MIKVYECSTSLEAHMIKNLLESEGVESRVDGEYLQGGIGELQAIGIVRVMVEESDGQKAKGIISNWEAGQVKSTQRRARKTPRTVNGFLVGFGLGVGVTYYLFNTPVTSNGIDYNNDGVLDEAWIYKGGRVVETKYDRNFDKIYDYVSYFDNAGLLKTADGDEDFDGVFESEFYFENGNLIREESDKNQNGVKDYQGNYVHGVLNTVELLDETSGKVRKRQYYKMNKMIAAEYDSNGDGQFDTRYDYDQFEERN